MFCFGVYILCFCFSDSHPTSKNGAPKKKSVRQNIKKKKTAPNPNSYKKSAAKTTATTTSTTTTTAATTPIPTTPSEIGRRQLQRHVSPIAVQTEKKITPSSADALAAKTLPEKDCIIIKKRSRRKQTNPKKYVVKDSPLVKTLLSEMIQNMINEQLAQALQ
ncbi:MAG: hypothetical protein FJ265_19750 [Planctomycetes bacterium]|nr:hypothetical protein [Planctomycetota bacterium]